MAAADSVEFGWPASQPPRSSRMQTVMLRLDSFLRRHRRAVLIAWVVVLLGAGPIDGVSLAPAARDRAVAQAGAGGTVLVPLVAEVDEDDATAVAVDLRDELAVADGPRDGVATHFVGQGAL